MNKQINVLVIGNGFDLYHYLPTRYVDFLRVVNRLIELEKSGRLSVCQYIKYLWGPDSPIYQQDEYIQKCYSIYTQKMQSVVLNQEKIKELVEITKNNIWIKYFQLCLEKDIGWIDFEKEIGNVLSATQRLFLLNHKTMALVKGIRFNNITDIDLKTIDILVHLPFVEPYDYVLVLKKEYCNKGFGGEYYVSIDKEKILVQLEEGLEELAKALCIYLKEFVQRIAIDKRTDNPVFYNIDKVLSFNYTDTYSKLYDESVEMKYIHGCINNEEKGIVLGINNDSKDEMQEMDTSLIKFKKYYQRAIKDTFYSVEDFLNDDDAYYKVSIVGHSIEITDRDILVGLMNHPKTQITIYYHDEKAHSQQVVNLISLVGKTQFDELRNKKKVVFNQLKEFKERVSELDIDEIDVDLDEYEIRREFRFLSNPDSISAILLIGNEIIDVGVREDGIGIVEVKLIDHFLNVLEHYNHAGYYPGVFKLVSLFNDNRYCGADVTIEYIKAADDTFDNMSEIRALFETECDGIGIVVSDIKIVDKLIG